MIKPNEQDKISFGCEDDETCVTSQQTSDSFLSDSKTNVRTSLDYYIRKNWRLLQQNIPMYNNS